MTEQPHDIGSEQQVKSILEWLALAHSHHGSEGVNELCQQLSTLREATLPMVQRAKLLDLLYSHTQRIVLAQLPSLHEQPLPVPRKIRVRVKAIQDLLASFSEDYAGTLPGPGEVQSPQARGHTGQTLSRMMQCLGWQLLVGNLVAAPPTIGVWQKFHQVYTRATELGVAQTKEDAGTYSIAEHYLASLLPAIAQPASFNSRELEFIHAYTAPRVGSLRITGDVPLGHDGVYWIDPTRDFPANALLRRSPPPDTDVLYFACDVLAQHTQDFLSALKKGKTAAELDLPEFADTLAGQGVLRRLVDIWGKPAKRRFPRRKQSHRAHLCAGLDTLWHLLEHDGVAPPLSEWMITNESPDGYAMMHLSGNTQSIRVGDIVAIRPEEDLSLVKAGNHAWHVCIVRWALSENPEHVEIGLQMLSPMAIPATLAVPDDVSDEPQATALLLPESPPLRPLQALVVPTGTLRHHSHKLILLVERENLEIRELRPAALEEQTSCIEVFSVVPDESP